MGVFSRKHSNKAIFGWSLFKLVGSVTFMVCYVTLNHTAMKVTILQISVSSGVLIIPDPLSNIRLKLVFLLLRVGSRIFFLLLRPGFTRSRYPLCDHSQNTKNIEFHERGVSGVQDGAENRSTTIKFYNEVVKVPLTLMYFSIIYTETASLA